MPKLLSILSNKSLFSQSILSNIGCIITRDEERTVSLKDREVAVTPVWKWLLTGK